MAKIIRKSANAGGTKAAAAQKKDAAKKERKPREPREPTEFEKAKEMATKHPDKLVRAWAERCGGRVRGKTTGLGVEGAWGYLLEKNTKAPPAERLTDAKISAWMKKEFPGKEGRDSAPTSIFEVGAIQSVRSKFNRGGFGGFKPEKPSQPWDGQQWLEVKRGRRPGAGAVVRKPKSDGVPGAKGFGKGGAAPAARVVRRAPAKAPAPAAAPAAASA